MRKWNFSAGPAAIPEEVLKETQSELLEWNQSGMSVTVSYTHLTLPTTPYV